MTLWAWPPEQPTRGAQPRRAATVRTEDGRRLSPAPGAVLAWVGQRKAGERHLMGTVGPSRGQAGPREGQERVWPSWSTPSTLQPTQGPIRLCDGAHPLPISPQPTSSSTCHSSGTPGWPRWAPRSLLASLCPSQPPPGWSRASVGLLRLCQQKAPLPCAGALLPAGCGSHGFSLGGEMWAGQVRSTNSQEPRSLRNPFKENK